MPVAYCLVPSGNHHPSGQQHLRRHRPHAPSTQLLLGADSLCRRVLGVRWDQRFEGCNEGRNVVPYDGPNLRQFDPRIVVYKTMAEVDDPFPRDFWMVASEVGGYFACRFTDDLKHVQGGGLLLGVAEETSQGRAFGKGSRPSGVDEHVEQAGVIAPHR